MFVHHTWYVGSHEDKKLGLSALLPPQWLIYRSASYRAFGLQYCCAHGFQWLIERSSRALAGEAKSIHDICKLRKLSMPLECHSG